MKCHIEFAMKPKKMLLTSQIVGYIRQNFNLIDNIISMTILICIAVKKKKNILRGKFLCGSNGCKTDNRLVVLMFKFVRSSEVNSRLKYLSIFN